MDDAGAALAFLRNHPTCNGKVGAAGFCLGGKLAYLPATRYAPDCSVGYYGVGIENALEEIANLKYPLTLHFAEKDQYCSPEAQKQIHAALDGNPLITLRDYTGQDHAFAHEGGAHFNAAAAELANLRTVEFFIRHLNGGTSAAKPVESLINHLPASPFYHPKAGLTGSAIGLAQARKTYKYSGNCFDTSFIISMIKFLNHLSENPEHSSAGSSKGKMWLLILILTSAWGSGCTGTDALRQRHARTLSQAEALQLPINLSSEELDGLERMGPLLDSVKLELGGNDELTGKIQIIFRGLDLLRNDTLHTKPGLEAFRGTWDAINSSWGGAARMLPTDAAVALAAVETSFRTASSTLSSASGLWQLVNPKPPGGDQERFERPANYWQQMYNDCFDKLDRVQNSELRKQTAGMLAHWLNNAHNVDRASGAQELQGIKVPLIIAQYLNGPSVLKSAAERSVRIVTQAGAIGKNPPPRVYVARFAVYLAIVRAYNERTQMEGMGVADSKIPLERRPFFQEAVRKHLWWVLTTPNFGIELHHPSEPTDFERARQYITGS